MCLFEGHFAPRNFYTTQIIKLKIIAHYELEAKIQMRKFTVLVQIKLGLKVGRVTIQRILNEKQKFLAS